MSELVETLTLWRNGEMTCGSKDMAIEVRRIVKSEDRPQLPLDPFEELIVRVFKRGCPEDRERLFRRLWSICMRLRCGNNIRLRLNLAYLAEWVKEICLKLGMTDEEFRQGVNAVHGWPESGEIGYYTSTILACQHFIRYRCDRRTAAYRSGAYWRNFLWQQELEELVRNPELQDLECVKDAALAVKAGEYGRACALLLTCGSLVRDRDPELYKLISRGPRPVL